MSALDQLIGSDHGIAEHFWGAVYERKPAVFKSSQGVEPLLSVPALDEFFAHSALPYPFIRVVKDHETIHFDGTRTDFALPRAEVDRRTKWYLDSLASGHSLIFQAINRFEENVYKFNAALSNALSLTIQINAYLTPPRSAAFDLHFDTHDVFIWQQSGTKHWTVFGQESENPRHEQRFRVNIPVREQLLRDGPIIDKALEPGDVLYIPSGFLHSGRCLDEHSLHLTVGLFRTGLLEDVIDNLGVLINCADDPQLADITINELLASYEVLIMRLKTKLNSE